MLLYTRPGMGTAGIWIDMHLAEFTHALRLVDIDFNLQLSWRPDRSCGSYLYVDRRIFELTARLRIVTLTSFQECDLAISRRGTGGRYCATTSDTSMLPRVAFEYGQTM